MKNPIKKLFGLTFIFSLIAIISSCSGQKELISFQQSSIDSLQQATIDAEQEKAELLAYNEELKSEKERMEEQMALMKANLASKDEILEETTRTAARLERWVEDTEAIVSTFSDYGVEVVTENGEIRLAIDEGLLFESGSDQINNRGEMIIDRIAEGILEMKDAEIMVEGHTDNVPMLGQDNNWDLSVDRSIAVVEKMITEYEISPQKLMVAGKSMYEPVVKNSNDSMKALNRRVEFIIIPDVDALILDDED